MNAVNISLGMPIVPLLVLGTSPSAMISAGPVKATSFDKLTISSRGISICGDHLGSTSLHYIVWIQAGWRKRALQRRQPRAMVDVNVGSGLFFYSPIDLLYSLRLVSSTSVS